MYFSTVGIVQHGFQLYLATTATFENFFALVCMRGEQGMSVCVCERERERGKIGASAERTEEPSSSSNEWK